MIAISSFRPFNESPEYKENQVRAHKSWLEIFDKIIYLSPREAELDSAKVTFIPHEWPRIRDMVGYAGKSCEPYAVILNADILLTSKMKRVFERMRESSVAAGMSKRLNYDHPNFREAKFTDYGLDIFVATPQVWRKVHVQIPQSFRIGHYLWDTWMSGFLNTLLKNKCVDFTPFQCVYHPNHGGRKTPHVNEINAKDRFIQMSGMPGKKLT